MTIGSQPLIVQASTLKGKILIYFWNNGFHLTTLISFMKAQKKSLTHRKEGLVIGEEHQKFGDHTILVTTTIKHLEIVADLYLDA